MIQVLWYSGRATGPGATGGENVDVALMYNPLYYLGLKGALNMANLLGKKDDASYFQKQMDILKPAFNKAYWSGKEYRSTGYQLLTMTVVMRLL